MKKILHLVTSSMLARPSQDSHCISEIILTFRRTCFVIYSYNESQRDALLLKFIW